MIIFVLVSNLESYARHFRLKRPNVRYLQVIFYDCVELSRHFLYRLAAGLVTRSAVLNTTFPLVLDRSISWIFISWQFFTRSPSPLVRMKVIRFDSSGQMIDGLNIGSKKGV